MTLTSEAVEMVLMDCLFDEGEPMDDAILPEGIVTRYGLHPGRLEARRAQVAGWIDDLPSDFLLSGGEGTSFLMLCNLSDGEQWTGLHTRMEQLVALAAGLGMARFVFPREMWEALPGGVPYVVFAKEGFPS